MTASFPPAKKPPLDVLKKWIDESYRAVAPTKLLIECMALVVGAAAHRRPAQALPLCFKLG